MIMRNNGNNVIRSDKNKNSVVDTYLVTIYIL